jgi:hypothetical protein
MKISEGLKVIERGWIIKPKGYRVKYQKLVNSELITDYSPDLEDKPLDSDVVAWRYAWKLYVATKSDSTEISDGELINIFVVDDSDSPVKYYATNQLEVFNRRVFEASKF